MTDVTDEMVKAAERVLDDFRDTDFDALDRVKGAIAAALAVASVVEGYVWCEARKRSNIRGSEDPLCAITACPGPHRSLLLGPEVTR